MKVPRIKWESFKPIFEVLILAVMTWATVESYKLRKEGELQTTNSTMPIVVFSIDKRNSVYFVPTLKNVGYGPAFNISVTNVRNREFKLNFNKIVGLPKDGDIDCTFDINDTTSTSKYFIRNDSSRLRNFLNYKGEHFGGRVSSQSFNNITIEYKDIAGRTYVMEQSLSFNWLTQELRTNVIGFPKLVTGLD